MQLFVSRSRAEYLAFPAGQNSFRQVHCWAQRLNRFRGNGAILASPSLLAMIYEGVRISDASRFMQWSHSTLPVTSGQCWSLVLPTEVGLRLRSVGRGRETNACCGRAQSSARWGLLVISSVTKGWQVSFFQSWMSFLLFLLCSFGALVTSTIGFIRMDFYCSLLFSGTTASFIDLSRPACVQYEVLMCCIIVHS